jgi:glutamate/tyrosine decarboxylase-like PLP-dependent enzyme
MRSQEELSLLIEQFFTCRPAELTAIFTEYLSVIEADSSLQPGGLMSRNYETAQNNPEIHTLPGNLKDARDTVFPYFWGTDEWFSKLHLENVKGPASYASLIGTLACLLKNPNLCTDTYSQRSNELEVKAITALANLIFYHTESPWGVFTMGGTISTLYGGKIGIEKVCPGAMETGIGGARLVGVVSSAAHYSNQTLAGWLGIGTNNLVTVPTGPDFAMDPAVLESTLDALYREGRLPAFVIATVGTTDAFGIDDVAAMREIIDRMAAAHGHPVPQLHIDAAVGWTLSFLTEYDLDVNMFGLEPEVMPIIAKAQRAAAGFRLADSVTIDFHKMGWGHYPSSAFIVNRREDLRHLMRDKSDLPYFCEAEYRRDPALFTLECSRPALGPYSVMAALNGIGLQGYQMLIANAHEMALYMKRSLESLDCCVVLNPENCGPSVVWWVLPKGRDAKAIYRHLLAGDLSEKERLRYFAEIRHLFDKRQAALDIRCDARLSFTTDCGFAPGGVHLPAWKAVFFNPKTDRDVVDRIVQSIENL